MVVDLDGSVGGDTTRNQTLQLYVADQVSYGISMDLDDIGPELRRIRRQEKHQAKQICAAADISVAMLGFIERNERQANWQTLKTIAEQMGYELRVELVPQEREVETLKLTAEDAGEARAYLRAEPDDRELVRTLLQVLPLLDGTLRDFFNDQVELLVQRLSTPSSSQSAKKKDRTAS